MTFSAPVHVPLALYASEAERDRLHSMFVASDFQSLQAHMTTCTPHRGFATALRCACEGAQAVMLPRMVTSVMCAVALGLAVGSTLRLIFPAF
jgi:hypothetical protein